MKLYYARGACSLAVRILIHEMGLKSQFESVDLVAKKTQSGEDFLKINPKGMVPTLVTEDNKILTENGVIQQYLADTHKAHQLLPPVGDFKRYRVLEWQNFIGSDLHKGVGLLFNPKLDKTTREDIVLPRLKKQFQWVDKQLSEKKYLTGDFTVADAYLFVILTWLPHVQMSLEQYPQLNRYFKEIKTRKSVQQSLEEESSK